MLDSDIIIFGASPYLLSKNNESMLNSIDFSYFERKISKLNFKKIIYLSSASVYGLTDNEISFTETDNLLGVSSYACEKMYFESIIQNYCKKIKANALILRIAGLFDLGKKEQTSKNLIDKIFYQLNNEVVDNLDIVNSGNQIRNFCEVSFLKKVIEIFKNSNYESSIYNVANTSPIRLKDMIKKINLKIETPLKVNYIPSSDTNIHNSLDSSLLFNQYKSLSEFYINEDTLIKKLVSSYF